MKTTKKSNEGLLANTANLVPAAAAEAAATTASPVANPKPDSRLPIDFEARKHNRVLPTNKVLDLLRKANPDLFNVAEVVGKWVWVSFNEQPAPSLRQQLAQLGFHWNRERQAWQHPCGAFRVRGAIDPHQKYNSYFPADQQTA